MEFMLDREPSSDGQSRLPPATSGHAYPPVENSARPRHGRRAFAAGCRALGMGASGREPTQQTKPNQTPEADETYGRIRRICKLSRSRNNTLSFMKIRADTMRPPQTCIC